jgi:hypothetical protein
LYWQLKNIYSKEKDYRKALEMQEIYIAKRDSLSNQKLRQQAIEKDFEFNLEKRKMKTSF